MVIYIGFILKFNEPFIFLNLFITFRMCKANANLWVFFKKHINTYFHTMYSTSFTKLEESNKTIQRSAISKCWRKLGIHGNRFDSTITIVWKLIRTTFLQQVNLKRWTILVKCYTKWRKQTNKLDQMIRVQPNITFLYFLFEFSSSYVG